MDNPFAPTATPIAPVVRIQPREFLTDYAATQALLWTPELVTVRPVPEPDTLVILVVALAAMGVGKLYTFARNAKF